MSRQQSSAVMIHFADLSATMRRDVGPMVSAAHPPPITPQQLQAQQQAEMQKRELAKRQSRKPTDKNIPDGIEGLVVGDGVQRYRQLRDAERKLDAVMMRKRLDITESSARNFTRYRTMRVWISNTADNQPWQNTSMDPDAFDFGSESQATYRVKIEGRLLGNDEDSEAEKEQAEEQKDADAMEQDGGDAAKKVKAGKPAANQRTKLSHFFKQITINFDRSQSLQPDGYTSIEWKKPENSANANDSAANFDTLEFERKSDENINVTVNLFRDESPERFKLSPPLAELLGTEEDDRGGILMGIWIYVKANSLQEDEDSRKIRCDAQLKSLFENRDFVPFPQIPQLIIPHLSQLPPYQLPYTIRVDKHYIAPDDGTTASQPTIYDVLVPLDDPLRIAMGRITTNPQMLNQIASLDESLALAVQAIQHSKAKHAFYTAFSTDPVNFVKRWISSQQRDLDVILGEATRGGGEDVASEEFRRGGKEGVWGGDRALESVGLWLAKAGKAH
ncbi:SWI/SNF and RSC complex subunit Ssr3 [Diplodia seriata]|uniref:Putative swi-snf complex subunit n=1 Tax=Diplodia seriata TaxID=420778 RepID=A0A0G2DZ78_9PEZI|nr:putative swi-snf complex subunit [Diplodia seriata]OMP89003.1 SWI/SNF and RSC complexes subunit ssr3 [Diplodia seriata]